MFRVICLKLVSGDLLKDEIIMVQDVFGQDRVEPESCPITWFLEISKGNLCPEYKTKPRNLFILAGALAPDSSVPLQGVRLANLEDLIVLC